MKYVHYIISNMDEIIVKSLAELVEKNLSSETITKIKSRLFEKYGITWTQSLEEFEKLSEVLEEFFGHDGAKGLHRKFCESII